MTRKLLTVELVDHTDGPYYREWYCKQPSRDVLFAIIRSEWLDDPLATPVQRIFEIRILVTCAAPGCDKQVGYPRRRFCSDKCARRARRAEKNVENPEFGKATIRMIRAAARRTGANDIATFAMLWDLQTEVAAAIVEAIDDLKTRGFSYEALAGEIGVSRNAVSQWHKRHQAKLDAVNEEFTG